MIPYSTQSISAKDVKAVAKVLRSGWLTQGPAVERFEKLLAKKVGAKYAVAVTSGTAALHAAYVAAGVEKGDEVIVPAITFAATANAALYLGAKPVFADIDSMTGLIDVADAKRKITKKTKALVAVDYAGRPADLAALKALAKKHNLIFIEDAAQSLGARYNGKPVGTQADITTFSFHPVKSITTGEGGAVVTNDARLAKRVARFRTHGITKDTDEFVHQSDGPWYQEMHELGFNYRMTDLQAALGASQLTRLDSFIKKRRTLAKHYDKLFAGFPGIQLPPVDTRDAESAWHLYPIQVSATERRRVFESLRAAGIGVQVHYLPVYRHPFYEKLGYKKELCPNAEAFYAGEISIPLFPALSQGEQKRIVRLLGSILHI